MEYLRRKFIYQEQAADNILEKMYSKQYEAVVLAAAPGAGKTSILVHILNRFFLQNPNKKVVVFANNQRILVEQMLSDFEVGPVEPTFTYGLFGSGLQVEIGIVSQHKKIPQNFDLMVVDEAHQYYGAKTLNKIVLDYRPEYKLLMTGTPEIYNDVNKDYIKEVFGMCFISGNELYDRGVYSPLFVSAVTCDGTIEEKYEKAMAKLQSCVESNDSKVIVACKNKNEAYCLSLHIRKTRKVAVSTCENDSKSTLIKDFKEGKYDVLIVVNKGVLGFSDNKITALIDLKCTMDPNTRYQLFARVLRRHPNNIRKFYISCTNSKDGVRNCDIIRKATDLLKYQTFIGND